jgi:hypothetical protein
LEELSIVAIDVQASNFGIGMVPGRYRYGYFRLCRRLDPIAERPFLVETWL